MKSAYELAMERLEKNAPTVNLSEEQKAQIAEIDSSYKARIAEKEFFLQGKIARRGTGISRILKHCKSSCDGNPAPARGLRGEKSQTPRVIWQ